MRDTKSIILEHLQLALSALQSARLDMKSLGFNDELQTSDEEQNLWGAVEYARKHIRTAQNKLEKLML